MNGGLQRRRKSRPLATNDAFPPKHEINMYNTLIRVSCATGSKALSGSCAGVSGLSQQVIKIVIVVPSTSAHNLDGFQFLAGLFLVL